MGAQNAHNWTASIVIGIEPKSAQIETAIRALSADHAYSLRVIRFQAGLLLGRRARRDRADQWRCVEPCTVLGGAGLVVRIRAEERQRTLALRGEYERFAAGCKRLVLLCVVSAQCEAGRRVKPGRGMPAAPR